MKIIKLSNGGDCIVDDEDFDFLNKWKWYRHNNGYAFRCTTKYLGGGRKNRKIKSSSMRMHRVIMNAPIGLDVDHVNKNRLDNRRCNLRICSRSQNLCHSIMHNNNTSGYRGVSYYKSRNKFEAYVDFGKKRKKIGYFDSAIDAAIARDKVAKDIQGEFATLNFP